MFGQIKTYILKWLMSGMKEDKDLDGDVDDLADSIEEISEKQPEQDYPVTLADNEFIDNWSPPARYCVHTGGMDIWCDQVKPSFMSIDCTIL
jgi:hypothetical protein